MLNVIRMELHRMLHTRSFYVTMGAAVMTVLLLLFILAPSMNQAFDALEESGRISTEMADFTLSVNMAGRDVPCPLTVSAQFIILDVMFVVIFMACFVGSFYKDGFCKNVIGCRGRRYVFQIAKSVCAMVYAAVIVLLTAAAALVLSKLLIHGFTFAYMGEFVKFLLGEWCLLSTIGTGAAFITELSLSKIPAIVYILLTATNLMAAVLGKLDQWLGKWLAKDIFLEDYLPTLYQSGFLLEASDHHTANHQMLFHAVVLSLVFFVIYNAAGAALITKRDIK